MPLASIVNAEWGRFNVHYYSIAIVTAACYPKAVGPNAKPVKMWA